MLAKDVRRGAIGKRGGETHAAGDLGHHPPVRLRVARRRQERPLARDAPLGIGDGAVLLAPGGGRQQNVRAGIHRIVREHVLGDHEQLELLQRIAHMAGARQRDRGIGRHHPQRLDLAAGDGVEHLHRLEAFARRDPRRLPEAADAVDVLRHERHVRRELVGEAADLAPAHGIGLAGQRERSLAAPPDAAGRQMAVDDGIDLVGALRGLVHALREAGDGVGRRAEEIEELRDIGRRQAGELGGRGEVGRDLARARQRVLEGGRVRVDIAIVERVHVGEVHHEPAEQHRVHAGREAEKQVGILRRHGATRIDHDDPGAALALVLDHALEQHRVAPGGIRADEDEEVGRVEVLIGAGHGVGAEGAAVAGHRGRHAQPRIGVDIGRADEAFHQLVGDVVVLGEELAGEIEGDGVRPVAIDDALEAVGDPVERDRPVDAREASVRPAAAWDGAAAPTVRASRPAPSPWSRGARDWRDGRDRPRSPRRHVRPATPAPRNRRRNTGRWCARSADAATVAFIAHAAARVASARPNMRSSRRRATDAPVRIRSRYQRPSAVSPNSTAPMRRSFAMTSFL